MRSSFDSTGDVLRLAAIYGPIPFPDRDTPQSCLAGMPRSARLGKLIHMPDIARSNRVPGGSSAAATYGTRAALATPLLREGLAVGAIIIRRVEARPFTRQADRSAEDFRRPSRDRHRERAAVPRATSRNRISRSLEQQTATSEILRVIASSPTDIQPVLDMVAESAAKLCDATNAVIMRVVGDGFQRVAQFGDAPEPPVGTPSLVEPQLVGPFWTGGPFM